MPLHHPPSSFVQRLQDVDPHLRLRWSDAESRYRLERKVSRGRQPDPACYAAWDDYVCARDGFAFVFPCQGRELDDRVIATLFASDLWRRGGAEVVTDEMEAGEAEAAELQRTKWLDDIRDETKDWFYWANSLMPGKTTTAGEG